MIGKTYVYGLGNFCQKPVTTSDQGKVYDHWLIYVLTILFCTKEYVPLSSLVNENIKELTVVL
jgi:hypothetical protein